MASPVLTMKAGDTYPAWVVAIGQDGEWLNISSAKTMSLVLKGLKTATYTSGSLTAATVGTITATTAEYSPVLTNVSSFSNVQVGMPLLGSYVPGLTTVIDYDVAGSTITMSADATFSAAGQTITVGQGAAYFTPATTLSADDYYTEVYIDWLGDGTELQTIPNSQQENPIVRIDPRLGVQ